MPLLYSNSMPSASLQVGRWTSGWAAGSSPQSLRTRRSSRQAGWKASTRACTGTWTHFASCCCAALWCTPQWLPQSSVPDHTRFALGVRCTAGAEPAGQLRAGRAGAGALLHHVLWASCALHFHLPQLVHCNALLQHCSLCACPQQCNQHMRALPVGHMWQQFPPLPFAPSSPLVFRTVNQPAHRFTQTTYSGSTRR